MRKPNREQFHPNAKGRRQYHKAKRAYNRAYNRMIDAIPTKSLPFFSKGLLSMHEYYSNFGANFEA